MQRYIASGVEELDHDKLPTMLELRYNTLADAENTFGGLLKVEEMYLISKKFIWSKSSSSSSMGYKSNWLGGPYDEPVFNLLVCFGLIYWRWLIIPSISSLRMLPKYLLTYSSYFDLLTETFYFTWFKNQLSLWLLHHFNFISSQHNHFWITPMISWIRILGCKTGHSNIINPKANSTFVSPSHITAICLHAGVSTIFNKHIAEGLLVIALCMWSIL